MLRGHLIAVDQMEPKLTHKRNKWEHERDLADIATLFLKQRTHHEITTWLNANRAYQLSRQMISRDIERIRQMWREKATEAYDDRKMRELEKVERVEREAWTAFERSQQEETYKSSTRHELEVGQDEGGKALSDGRTTKTVAMRSQTGDPRFLDIVMRCIEKRCEILGLDAPKKVEADVTHTAILGGLPDDHVDRILSDHYVRRIPDSNGNGHTPSENGNGSATCAE